MHPIIFKAHYTSNCRSAILHGNLTILSRINQHSARLQERRLEGRTQFSTYPVKMVGGKAKSDLVKHEAKLLITIYLFTMY